MYPLPWVLETSILIFFMCCLQIAYPLSYQDVLAALSQYEDCCYVLDGICRTLAYMSPFSFVFFSLAALMSALVMKFM